MRSMNTECFALLFIKIIDNNTWFKDGWFLWNKMWLNFFFGGWASIIESVLLFILTHFTNGFSDWFGNLMLKT